VILGSVKCREAGEGGIWASSPTHVPPHSQAPKAKRKAESWERSVGTLGSRPQLSGLVVVKRTDLGCSAQEGLASSPTTQGPMQSGKPADPAPWAPGVSSLSQLGAYSDSEDSSGSN